MIRTTVTDLGGSTMVAAAFPIVAEIGLGSTASGASNVFTESTRGAVSTSPRIA